MQVKNSFLIFLSVFISFCFHGLAQQAPATGATYKIKGKIIDSATRQPAAYATVMATLAGSTVVAGGNLTDDNGQFTIDNLAAGEYVIRVEFLGYNPVTKTGVILSDKKTVTNMGSIALSSTSKNLTNVTVTAKRSFMETHLDKLVYNVDKDITSEGGVATDILKKVPMVSVDIDGNVDLLGDPNVRVFINGKPSTMFDNNLAEALKSIPASQIKSIEVITSPGAQYDAQGTGGIINIILKDNKIKGMNGNCSLSGGTRYENGSVNVHVKNGALDVNGSLSGNGQLNTRSITSLNRTADSTSLTQDGYNQGQRMGYRAQAGFDWAFSKTDDISGSCSYNDWESYNQGMLTQSQITDYPISDTTTTKNSNNDYRYKGQDWNINYKKKYATEGQELNLSYQGSIGYTNTNYSQNQYYMQGSDPFSGGKGDNHITDNEDYLTADYTQPFTKDIVMNVGVKGSFSRIRSNADYYGLIPATDYYYFDSAQANAFNYNRSIYAAYASITFPLFKNYNLKFGVRDEYTKNSVPDDTITIASYNFITPSGVISRTLKNNRTIKIAYTRRIQRPGFSQFNPFVNAADPVNLSQGNPFLQPQKMHSLELSYYKFYDKGSNILVTLFYRYSALDWQGYSTYYSAFSVGDSVYRNATVSRTTNAGTQQTGGLNVSGTWEATDKLEFRSNGSVFDKYIESTLPGGGIVNSVNYRVNLNVTYQFTKTLGAEVYGGYNSGTLEAQGKFPSFANYSIALRKQLLDKKASLAFTTTDPFNKYTSQTTYLSAENFSSSSVRKYPYQFFTLSFSYRFGKMEFKDKKQDDNDQGQPQDGHS